MLYNTYDMVVLHATQNLGMTCHAKLHTSSTHVLQCRQNTADQIRIALEGWLCDCQGKADLGSIPQW